MHHKEANQSTKAVRDGKDALPDHNILHHDTSERLRREDISCPNPVYLPEFGGHVYQSWCLVTASGRAERPKEDDAGISESGRTKTERTSARVEASQAFDAPRLANTNHLPPPGHSRLLLANPTSRQEAADRSGPPLVRLLPQLASAASRIDLLIDAGRAGLGARGWREPSGNHPPSLVHDVCLGYVKLQPPRHVSARHLV